MQTGTVRERERTERNERKKRKKRMKQDEIK